MTRKKRKSREELTEEVKYEHEQVINGASIMLNHAIAVGMALWKLKERIEYREYRTWVKEHFDFSITNEWRYRKIAQNRKNLKPYIQDRSISTIDQACKWLSKERRKKKGDVKNNNHPKKDPGAKQRSRIRQLKAYLVEDLQQEIETWPESRITFYGRHSEEWKKIIKKMRILAKNRKTLALAKERQKKKLSPVRFDLNTETRKVQKTEKSTSKDAA